MPRRPPKRPSKKASSPAAAWHCCVAKRQSTSTAWKGDEALGAEIVRKVLDWPLSCIAENAGVDGAVVVNRVRQMKGKTDGYDADRDEYTDLVARGIIDPAKVVRIALQNAASVASFAADHLGACDRHSQRGRRSGRPRSSRPRHGWHGRNGRRHGRNGWHGRHDVSECKVQSAKFKMQIV